MSIFTAIEEWNQSGKNLTVVVFSVPEVMEWIAYQIPSHLYVAGMTEDQAALLSPHEGIYLFNWHLPEIEEKA